MILKETLTFLFLPNPVLWYINTVLDPAQYEADRSIHGYTRNLTFSNIKKKTT